MWKTGKRVRLKLKWPSPEYESIEYPNVDDLVGTLVAHRYATLHELKTVYTLEDVEDMYEIIAVTKYNEHLAMNAATKRRK